MPRSASGIGCTDIAWPSMSTAKSVRWVVSCLPTCDEALQCWWKRGWLKNGLGKKTPKIVVAWGLNDGFKHKSRLFWCELQAIPIGSNDRQMVEGAYKRRANPTSPSPSPSSYAKSHFLIGKSEYIVYKRQISMAMFNKPEGIIIIIRTPMQILRSKITLNLICSGKSTICGRFLYFSQ